MPPGPKRLGVLGAGERNLKILREALGVNIAARGDTVKVHGDRRSVGVARSVLDRLVAETGAQQGTTRDRVLEIIADESRRAETPAPGGPVPGLGWDGTLDVYNAGGRAVRPMSESQEVYLRAIADHDLVFGVGPAGTGKTYLAVAAAVQMLKSDSIRKIVLVRPAVEAGERLGFLPGGLEEKVNPYLRPLLDALHDMVDQPTIRRFMETDVVEVAPLAFMRGRTLNHSVVILDEAQNTTKGQMKMFLTRMGMGSKMIVTGDTTQIDLPDPTESGLVDAARRLARSPGVAFCQLDAADVVRHPMVRTVVKAYGGDEREMEHGRRVREALEGIGDEREPSDGD
ncbi:MAG: PhoH family protein [Planctomycetota bacterium]